MELILGALADYGSADGRGKITVVGVFDTVYVVPPAKPPVPQDMTIVLVVSASIMEGTDHKGTLELVDADGKVLGRIEVPLIFAARGPGYPTRAQVVLNMKQVVLPKLGDFAWRVLVKNKLIGRIPFYVLAAPKNLVPPSPPQA